jgi:hypothetical protein
MSLKANTLLRPIPRLPCIDIAGNHAPLIPPAKPVVELAAGPSAQLVLVRVAAAAGVLYFYGPGAAFDRGKQAMSILLSFSRNLFF